jgi:hypothetical protein
MTLATRLAATAAAIVLAAGAASASSFTVTQQQPGPTIPNVFDGTANKSVSYTFNGSAGSSVAGQFALTGDNGFGDFLAFCVDLERFLNNGLGKAYHVNNGLFGDAVVDNLTALYNTAHNGLNTSVANEMAGFQLAAWEIVYDSNDLDLEDGVFQSADNGGARAVAAGFLTGLTGPATGNYRLTFLDSDSGGQDLVTATPVPLPAAAWMLGAGVAALAAAGRRRRA